MREQEVERRPVAHGSREHHRDERVVAHQQEDERQESSWHEERPRDGQCVHDEHVQRLDDVSAELGQAAAASVVGVHRERRAPQHPDGLGGQTGLLARLVTPEVEDELAVVALLLALVDIRGLAGERQVSRELGPGWPAGGSGTSSIQPPSSRTARVFALFAFQTARASVVSVKQPTCACFAPSTA